MECYYRLICLWICFPFFIIYFLKSSSNFSSNFWWLDLIEIGCCISLFSDELKDNWKRKFQWTIFLFRFPPFLPPKTSDVKSGNAFLSYVFFIYIYVKKVKSLALHTPNMCFISIEYWCYFLLHFLKKNDKKWIKMISLSVGYIYLGVPHQVDWIWTHFGLVVIFSTHYKLTSKSCSITGF